MEKIVKPIKALSFEEALRNLASRLTGTPVAELPRTQEAIVQYMAENINLPGGPTQVTNENITIQGVPGLDVDKMCEAITQEVMARLDLDALGEAVTKEVLARITESMGANLAVTEPPAAAQDGVEGAGGTSTPPAAETPQEAPKTPAKAAPKTGGGRKPKAKAET